MAICLVLSQASCTCRLPAGGDADLSDDEAQALSSKSGTSPPRRAVKAKGAGAPLELCEAGGQYPIEAAQDFFDRGDFEKAFSCAAEASALAPSDPAVHAERGNALAALGRYQEAQLAYARALAIDPDSIEALAGAAHLYTVLVPSSRENDELGLAYAEHGFDLAMTEHEAELAVDFARLSAMALNDTGQARDALERAEWVLGQRKDDAQALYERAVALFELCRFKQAQLAFTELEANHEQAAFAHQHLGLILEREGAWSRAEAQFDLARRLDPSSFPAPVLLEPAAFKTLVQQVTQRLPSDMRRDLDGIEVDVEELPREEDLTAVDPPLSPTILGLFRGPSLGQTCEGTAHCAAKSPCRSIALYRRNLSRAARSMEELEAQVEVTLLHEIGHLRGEDDSELAARGLE